MLSKRGECGFISFMRELKRLLQGQPAPLRPRRVEVSFTESFSHGGDNRVVGPVVKIIHFKIKLLSRSFCGPK